jgi:hypothetical protein
MIRCTCVFAKKLTWCLSIWAATTLTRSQHCGCNIPTFLYVVVDGIQYNVNPHMSIYCFCRIWNFALDVVLVCLHLKNLVFDGMLWIPKKTTLQVDDVRTHNFCSQTIHCEVMEFIFACK